jgi:hypothetical protein
MHFWGLSARRPAATSIAFVLGLLLLLLVPETRNRVLPD